MVWQVVLSGVICCALGQCGVEDVRRVTAMGPGTISSDIDSVRLVPSAGRALALARQRRREIRAAVCVDCPTWPMDFVAVDWVAVSLLWVNERVDASTPLSSDFIFSPLMVDCTNYETSLRPSVAIAFRVYITRLQNQRCEERCASSAFTKSCDNRNEVKVQSSSVDFNARESTTGFAILVFPCTEGPISVALKCGATNMVTQTLHSYMLSS